MQTAAKPYGDLDPSNHAPDGKQEWTKTETTHEKKWSCCGAVIVASEAHEWSNGVGSECGYVCLHTDDDRNHICDLCDKVITNHTGGKATCTEKSVCEVCKKAYGEIDANNHTGLQHIDAKSATKTSNGNIEYWHCKNCDKYFKDAECKNEIKLSDTIIKKIADNSKKQTKKQNKKKNKKSTKSNSTNNSTKSSETSERSPQTGDKNNIILWIILLFVSSGTILDTLVHKKKRNK